MGSSSGVCGGGGSRSLYPRYSLSSGEGCTNLQRWGVARRNETLRHDGADLPHCKQEGGWVVSPHRSTRARTAAHVTPFQPLTPFSHTSDTLHWNHPLTHPSHTRSHPSEPPLPQPTLHSAARPRASSAPAARPSSTAVRSTSALTGRRAGTRRSAPRQVRPGPGPPGPPRPASNSTSSPSLPSTWLRRRS